jgi:hypothetical protein
LRNSVWLAIGVSIALSSRAEAATQDVPNFSQGLRFVEQIGGSQFFEIQGEFLTENMTWNAALTCNGVQSGFPSKSRTASRLRFEVPAQVYARGCFLSWVLDVANHVYPYQVWFVQPSGAGGGVHVLQATYGDNHVTVQAGNASWDIAASCNGLASCDYRIDYRTLGDPAPGHAKSFAVRWTCDGAPTVFTAGVAAEAGWGDRSVHLGCGAPVSAMTIASATYGGNTGLPAGNATWHVANACNGQRSCAYTVWFGFLGDPAPGQAKDWFAQYQCTGESDLRSAYVAAEAGFGSVVQLACP